MRLIKYLTEESYTLNDIPKYFYVVFDLKDVFKDLLTGKIPGLKGISSSGEIEFQFLNVARDAMLIMDSKELLKLNKVTRIMYDNPMYLVSKDMEALYRIFNMRRDKNGRSRVLGNLLEYMELILKRGNVVKEPALAHDMRYYGITNYGYEWSGELKKVNGLKDLAKFLERKLGKEFPRKESERRKEGYTLSYNDYYKLIFEALLEIGRVYGSESEWVIKDSVLHVPPKSELQILMSDMGKMKDEKIKVVDYCIKNDIDKPDPKKMREEGFSDIMIIWTVSGGHYELERLIALKKMITQLNTKTKYKVVLVDLLDFKTRREHYWKSKGMHET